MALYGAAYDQIVALYNWWQKAATPAGQRVTQFSLIEYPNANAIFPPWGAIKLYPPLLAFGGQSMYLVPAQSVTATGELSALLTADPDYKIDVTVTVLPAIRPLAFQQCGGL